MKISKGDETRLLNAFVTAGSSDHKYRIGSLLYSGGRLISYGINSTRMVDMEPFDKCMEHSEEMTLRKVNWSAPGGTLYVARRSYSDEPRLAMPCLRCIAHLEAARVSRIVWTTDGGARSARMRDMRNNRAKLDNYLERMR